MQGALAVGQTRSLVDHRFRIEGFLIRFHSIGSASSPRRLLGIEKRRCLMIWCTSGTSVAPAMIAPCRRSIVPVGVGCLSRLSRENVSNQSRPSSSTLTSVNQLPGRPCEPVHYFHHTRVAVPIQDPSGTLSGDIAKGVASQEVADVGSRTPRRRPRVVLEQFLYSVVFQLQLVGFVGNMSSCPSDQANRPGTSPTVFLTKLTVAP